MPRKFLVIVYPVSKEYDMKSWEVEADYFLTSTQKRNTILTFEKNVYPDAITVAVISLPCNCTWELKEV